MPTEEDYKKLCKLLKPYNLSSLIESHIDDDFTFSINTFCATLQYNYPKLLDFDFGYLRYFIKRYIKDYYMIKRK